MLSSFPTVNSQPLLRALLKDTPWVPTTQRTVPPIYQSTTIGIERSQKENDFSVKESRVESSQVGGSRAEESVLVCSELFSLQ